MDELTPLRNTREDSRVPTDDALAKGRAALLNRAASVVVQDDAAPSPHDDGRPSAAAQRTFRPRWAAAALAVALTAVVVVVAVPFAISAGGGSGRPAVGVPSSTPLDEKPLEVTAQMYEAAYATFARCMRDNGSGLAAEYMEGAVHQYSYLAVDESAHAVCYPPFQQIDMAWQMAHTYDSPTYVALRKCLTDIGVTPASDAQGVYQQVLDHGIDPTSCQPPARNPYSRPQE
ncbi:hypothetical protein [Microbacterium sp. NPDC055455]